MGWREDIETLIHSANEAARVDAERRLKLKLEALERVRRSVAGYLGQARKDMRRLSHRDHYRGREDVLMQVSKMLHEALAAGDDAAQGEE